MAQRGRPPKQNNQVKSSGNSETPANAQRGKKRCTKCHEEKKLLDFYTSTSPMYSIDKRVPICKDCVKESCLNEDGEIDEEKLMKTLRLLDKPYYKDSLISAYEQFKRENPFIDSESLIKYGSNVLGYYFKNIMMKQDRNKTYSDSEKDGFVRNGQELRVSEKEKIIKKYEKITSESKEAKVKKQEETIINGEDSDFEVTQEIVDMFGEGFTKNEYRKMQKKYNEMIKTYVVQTNLHKEALLTYVRFKVKEEIATAKGDVVEAQKWYQSAQNAGETAKLTPKQLTKEDFQGGMNTFSDIFSAVEGAKERIKIFPEFKYQPRDSADFIIWCYVNYERNLNNLPEVEYRDIYKFYDEKKKEYLETNGDIYGLFKDDTTEQNRETVSKFITVPKEFGD